MTASRRSTLALLGALACASHIPRGLAQTAQTLPVLRVAIISRTVFYAPLWAAQAQHLFRDQGLSVVITVYDNAERITQDLREGKIDIAIATPESIMVDAYHQGPLRMVAGNAEKLPHHIIARPHIQSPKDLKGARFGVLSLNEGTAYLVKRYAASVGLKPDEYSMVAVGGAPTRWKRLQEASIDVGFQPFPLSYVAEEAGYTNLGTIASLVPDWLFTSINVHQQWAQQNGDMLRQFLKVLRSAQNQLAAQQQALTPMLERELQTTDVFASRAMAHALRLNMFAPQLRVHEPAAQAVFDALLETDQIPRGTVFRRETFFDPSYL
jgi:ABC-type nitrate/sulfonate/bicarbonate transport system substrate-binding protein